nr:very short patch repair endonuclease [Nordella sp. HKS 07]
MASIRDRDTRPEIAVRRRLHAMGFRYLLHNNCFPGRPYLVMPKFMAVIWIHGCYWNGHDCAAARLPSSNESYWHPKIARTKERENRILKP